MTAPEVRRGDDRYLTDDYVSKNPSWDMEDSPWKAAHVVRLLREHNISPKSICEVGCGAGLVLAELRKSYPEAELFGYDIAPAATRFWSRLDQQQINFVLGDFASINKREFDVILLLDVIEHVRDPMEFLAEMRMAARYFVLHIPLDLSAASVMRGTPLMDQRFRVGHIHYFTKQLALATVEESGYRVAHHEYSGAGFSAPRKTWRTRVAMAPRWIAGGFSKDWAVRVFGGETLFVLAEATRPNGGG